MKSHRENEAKKREILTAIEEILKEKKELNAYRLWKILLDDYDLVITETMIHKYLSASGKFKKRTVSIKSNSLFKQCRTRHYYSIKPESDT